MKKLSILSVIFGLFLTLNVSAQFKIPENEKALTTEQKMLPFAMSMSLSVVSEMHDEQYLAVLKIFQKQVGYWSEELKPMVELEVDVADYKRMEIAVWRRQKPCVKNRVSRTHGKC